MLKKLKMMAGLMPALALAAVADSGSFPADLEALTRGPHRLTGTMEYRAAADHVTGGFMSEPFFPADGEVRVDADITGWLRAELCDAFGRKLPGFNLNDSIPVTGDSESHVLKWKSANLADHLHECLRLRFEFHDGVVYNFAF